MLEKMDRYLIIVIIALFFTGCSKDTPDFEAKIILNQSSIDAPSSSRIFTIQIITNSSWEASSNVDWIVFNSPTNGEKGVYDFIFEVMSNTGTEERTATITFSTKEGTSTELTINQSHEGLQSLYVKVDGDGDGTSWSDAASLDSALANAKFGYTIHIAAGTYIPTVILVGADEADLGNKTFFIDKNISLKGGYPANVSNSNTEADPEQHKTILSGDDKCYHVVTISAPHEDDDAMVSIEGITITGGNSNRGNTFSVPLDGNNFNQEQGAGIIIGNTKLNLTNCKIINNNAGQTGGIHAFNGASLYIYNSKINNNSAIHHNAGIWLNRNCTAVITDSEIIGNETGAGVGGGIYTYSNCKLDLYNVIISSNKAGNHGGGLYVRANSTANLVNTIITNNNITAGDGAGVMLYDNSSMNVVSSTITQNSTIRNGGGIYLNVGENILNVYNSIISGNVQISSSNDIARNDITSKEPIFKNSVISDKTYNNSGIIESSAILFDFNSMLVSLNNNLFGVLEDDDNPAIKFGLSPEALINIGNTLEPKVSSQIISNDLNKNSRNNLTTMGAIVKH